MSARGVCFANNAVAVEWTGDRAAGLVKFLFGSLPDGGADRATVTLRLSPGRGEDELHMVGESPADERLGPAGVVAVHMMERATYHLADRSQGGALFHAACLRWQDKALLLPGTSGSGKSSLAVWLAMRGFGYMSDELAFITYGELDCQGLGRPSHLKPPARALFPDLLECQPADPGVLPVAPGGWLVSPGRLGAEPAASPRPLGCIVFPRYMPGADFQLERLARASAAVALAAVLVNARNLPDNGFPELLRLARSAPAYQVTYSNFDQIQPAIQTLLSTPPAR